MPAKVRARVQSRAGRPTKGELDRRKRRVIKAATRLFVDKGYAATSLVDIARQSGVATRTIYQHFGDKAALFREVLCARDNAPDVKPPSLSEVDPLQTLLMRVAHYVVEVAFNPQTVRLMRLMVAEHHRFAELTKKVANTTYDIFYESVAEIFSQLWRLGRIPPGDQLESAKFFADFILGATPFYNYTNWLDKAPTESQLKAKVSLFILGRFGVEVAKSAHLGISIRSDTLASSPAASN